MRTKLNAVVQALGINYYDLIRDEFAECLECSRPIYNPVCPQCVFDEFISWLDNYPKLRNKRKITQEVVQFLRAHRTFNGHSGKCVACNKNNAYLCPYCFTAYLFGLVKQNSVDRVLLGEFLILFNFDYSHNGYYKEGEKLGVF
jgi:hypothetical protein